MMYSSTNIPNQVEHKSLSGIPFSVVHRATRPNMPGYLEPWFTLAQYPDFTFCFRDVTFLPNDKEDAVPVSFATVFETAEMEEKSRVFPEFDSLLESFFAACMLSAEQRAAEILEQEETT